MRNLSVQRVGGAGSVLSAVSIIFFVVLVVWQATGTPGPGATPWRYVLADYALALVGISGLAVVPAVSERVSPLSPGWVRLTGTLAQVGFAVLAMLSLWQAEYEQSLAIGMGSLPGVGIDVTGTHPTAATTLAAVWDALAGRLPQGLLEVGGIGLWIFSVCWLAKGSDLLPAGAVEVGIVAGLVSSLTVTGSAFQVTELLYVGQAASLVLLPVWFAWIGHSLLQAERSSRLPAHRTLWSLAGGATGFRETLRERTDRQPAARPEPAEDTPQSAQVN